MKLNSTSDYSPNQPRISRKSTLGDRANSGLSSLGSLNTLQEKDLQVYYAEEKYTLLKKSVRRRLLWQTLIFLLACSVNQLVSFRDHLIVDVGKETPDSILSTAVSLFKGIGYIIIGNLYDNVRMPKRLTFYLLVVLALLTSLVSIYCKTNVERFSAGGGSRGRLI